MPHFWCWPSFFAWAPDGFGSRGSTDAFGMGDSESYWALGLAIAEGKPYEYGPEHAQVFRTPGYPMLLAPILRVFGDDRRALLLARAEAALLGTLAVAGVWWLTRLLFDDRAAMLAAVLATFYPGAIVLSVLDSQRGAVLSADAAAILVCGLPHGRPEAKATHDSLALAAGLSPALATLMRPSWLLFTPFAAVVGMLLALVQRSFARPLGEGPAVQGRSASRQRANRRRLDPCFAT